MARFDFRRASTATLHLIAGRTTMKRIRTLLTGIAVLASGAAVIASASVDAIYPLYQQTGASTNNPPQPGDYLYDNGSRYRP